MCGIIGYIGSQNAVPIILNGLYKLEYRGYDSAGMAVYSDESLKIIKKKGRIDILKKATEENGVSGFAGIGHTRWATHGEPSDVNSHPHYGSKGKIAIVHNGIIENYKTLKEDLQSKGVVFISETDSEVIAQLAEYYYDGDIIDTIIKVTKMLEGSYALGILCADEPDKLFAIKKDNPLIIGVGSDGNYIASDVPAILEHTRNVYYLDHNQIAALSRDGVTFCNMEKEPVEKEITKIEWDVTSAEKSGYKHFMLKEIMEQPKVLRDTISSIVKNKKISDENFPDIRKYNKILITACGSAYNVGMVSKYVIEQLSGISVEVDLASEFRYRNPVMDDKTLVIVISQSGETADTIAAMREAKRKGVTTLAVVNVVGSTVAKEADYTIYTMAGPEIAVATTKAYSTQLCVMYLLGLQFAQKIGAVGEAEAAKLLDEIILIPSKIESILSQTEQIQQCAALNYDSKSIFFIGRNIDYAISLEGSLKLKEISYIHSEAYAGGELKHGTISLIEEDTLVVAISCCDRLFGKIWSNIEQVISRGAKVMLITNNDSVPNTDRLTVLSVPEVHELFSPSLSVVILQLFSYYVASNRGCDIDKPRNLAKSVTVE